MEADDENMLVFPGKGGNRLDTVKRLWAAVLRAATFNKFRGPDIRKDFSSKPVVKGVLTNRGGP